MVHTAKCVLEIGIINTFTSAILGVVTALGNNEAEAERISRIWK